MKKNLLTAFAATLLVATTAVAGPPAPTRSNDGRRSDQDDRRNDQNGNGKDSNYGYDKSHKVTSEERTRWEATHKNNGSAQADNRDDRNRKPVSADRARPESANNRPNQPNDRRDAPKGQPGKDDKRNDKNNDKRDDRNDKNDRRDDKNGQQSNYGYDKNHKVTPQERARWEAAHKDNN